MKISRTLFSVVVAVAALASAARAASSWDGTWSGVMKTGDTVTVTILSGKVVGYSIRGAMPFGIQYSKITARTVAFGDNKNYSVRLMMRDERTAIGSAHSPVGDGSAALTKQ